MRTRERSSIARLLGLATLSLVACAAEPPDPEGTTEQAVINQLPGNLSPDLAAYKTWACGEMVSSELSTSVGCPAGTNIKICFADSAGIASSTPVSGGLVTVSIPASLTPISYLSNVIPGFSSLKLNGKAQMRVELQSTNGSFGTGDSGC